ncbi:MAG: hypothetical protein RL088_4168 [Verrucomicrobiota bacterium]
MSTRSILTIAIISTVACTGCKTVYSTVYTNKKNSFKPPVAVAKNELKGPEVIDALTAPAPGGLPPAMGNDQNAIPGIPGVPAAPAAPADPAAAPAPAAGAAPAIPGL